MCLFKGETVNCPPKSILSFDHNKRIVVGHMACLPVPLTMPSPGPHEVRYGHVTKFSRDNMGGSVMCHIGHSGHAFSTFSFPSPPARMRHNGDPVWTVHTGHYLPQSSVNNVFWKSPEIKYIRFCRPSGLCPVYSILPW